MPRFGDIRLLKLLCPWNPHQFDSSPFSEEAKVMLAGFRARVLTLTKSDLSLSRDDYREFAELCTLFLDGVEKDNIVTFKRPGALHKARWMAKLLYSVKICLLEKYIDQLSRGTITTPQQVAKVREFVNFATLLYSEWWTGRPVLRLLMRVGMTCSWYIICSSRRQ